jgi:hypothetical protein
MKCKPSASRESRVLRGITAPRDAGCAENAETKIGLHTTT